jgi:hypothetical protein
MKGEHGGLCEQRGGLLRRAGACCPGDEGRAGSGGGDRGASAAQIKNVAKTIDRRQVVSFDGARLR